MDPENTVTPAGVTNVAEPVTSMGQGHVQYERLAPGGQSYLPTTFLSPEQAHAATLHYPPQAQSLYPPPQPYPSNVQMPQAFAPPGYTSYMPPPGYYVPQPAAGYVGGGATAPASAPAGSTGHATGDAAKPKRTPIHAPGEPGGPLPYRLPDKLAVPLGYAPTAASMPTLGTCDVEGDAVTIRASGAKRWRLELKDSAWKAPIDAIADTKSATFRLQVRRNLPAICPQSAHNLPTSRSHNLPTSRSHLASPRQGASERTLTVRVCSVAPDGKFGKFTDWAPVTLKVPEPEPEPEPEAAESPPVSPLPPSAAPSATREAWAQDASEATLAEAHAVRHGGGSPIHLADTHADSHADTHAHVHTDAGTHAHAVDAGNGHGGDLDIGHSAGVLAALASAQAAAAETFESASEGDAEGNDGMCAQLLLTPRGATWCHVAC